MMDQTIIKNKPPELFTILRGIMSGKTLGRVLMNESLRGITIDGHVLDLGSKTNKPSYYNYFHLLPSSKIIFTDLYPSEDVIACDVRKRFPFSDAEFDVVMAFNLIEHVFEYNNVFAESFFVKLSS